MRFSPNLKKVLLIGTVILLGCDVSMLFAAQNDPQVLASPASGNNQQAEQQMQAQVQAQIRALQNQNNALGQNIPGNPAQTAQSPSAVLGAQSKNDLLPPAPYGVSAGATATIPPSPLPAVPAVSQPPEIGRAHV